MKSTYESARRSRAFKIGFVTGLAAPALLFAGRFETLPPRRIASISEAWRDVGQLLRKSAEQYKRQYDKQSA